MQINDIRYSLESIRLSASKRVEEMRRANAIQDNHQAEKRAAEISAQYKQNQAKLNIKTIDVYV
jgi:hypothetical protein